MKMGTARNLCRAMVQRLPLRRRSGISPYYRDGLEPRIREAQRHLEHIPGGRILEIGCGRDLHTALVLAVCGGKSVVAYDIEPLAELELVNFTLAALGRKPLTSLAGLADLGVRYVVSPALPREQPFDGIVSTAVLEHIPRQSMRTLVADLYAALIPGGRMGAVVDYKDHWSYLSAVSPFQFYSLEGLTWAILNNRRMYQNRLRNVDVLRLLAAQGFALVLNDEHSDHQATIHQPVSPSFRGYTEAELRVASSYIVVERSTRDHTSDTGLPTHS